jgi:hypothetical protein
MKIPALIIVPLLGPAVGQLIQIGSNDPDYCYKIEKIQPNLVLRKNVHITGVIRDGSLAPFQKSQIELRTYVSQHKQTKVRVVSTDGNGHFDLGIIKPGSYRWLASPTRMFKQPSELQCHDGKTCELEITLVASATDQPENTCPIR